MIFLETSAIVAVFLKQPDMLRVLNTLEKDPYIVTGAHVRLEACMVLSSRLAISATEANVRLQRFLDELKIAIEPLTDEIAIEAVLAFDKYGKGRNSKTSLNLADCMSYAFAKSRNLKILFTGTDFKGTDLKAA